MRTVKLYLRTFLFLLFALPLAFIISTMYLITLSDEVFDSFNKIMDGFILKD